MVSYSNDDCDDGVYLMIGGGYLVVGVHIQSVVDYDQISIHDGYNNPQPTSSLLDRMLFQVENIARLRLVKSPPT